MPVVFHEVEMVVLKKRKRLKSFIKEIFINEGKTLDSLDVIFCSDKYLLDINQQFLNHDFYTDIITFDLSESNSNSIIAELYISIERVKENAISLKTNFVIELHRVIFHGTLHLCGYKDKVQNEILTMRKKEDEYINLYFNP